MGWLVPAAIAGAAALAFSKKKKSGDAGGTGGAPAPAPSERGFRFINGCRDLEVTDENRALEWVRKLVAGLPNVPGWQQRVLAEAFGACVLPLSQDLEAAKAITQKHVAFLWRLTLYANRGAVDGGKLSEAAANQYLQQVIVQATELGIDPALLTPQTLPP
ncbi:hypothetical protein SAMN02745121_08570 [Nannocystis exedens]|uniref:Uncharacterized protein n=1 Tax=Nannocystis exedens TaxID=54 RepID=A0A1I2IAX0_9BACT|nr:hypothetical protein [Nannocystis exedens]PCC73141.1 hypothetical protein NAEX_06229 [Nannocystis exedens]SFF39364.1 hypothetical protein SAMN02745121_08570 [Nannocystis exedens]